MGSPDPDRVALPFEFLATTQLLRRAQRGEREALDTLTSRYVRRLRTWASGRLPMHARSLLDTGDLVQETFLRTLGRLEEIEVQGSGSFQAYVRSAVLNRIRDEVRWAARRPGPDGVPESLESPEPSPLEQAVGADLAARYERALATLPETEQLLLHLRVELDYDYEEIAEITGRPSRDAVRVAVSRALRRLAEAMGDD
jgi:RNA polymerase sigma-70 factor, ECF subfamily